MKGIIGKKVCMTQIFREDGRMVPVTVIQAGPCPVVQIKTRDSDGYEAIQLGFQEAKPSRTNRPLSGHFHRHGAPACKILKEFRVDDVSKIRSGQVVTAAAFEVGEKVSITAKSKGRGFTGVVSRHGFRGAPGSHGTHEYFRHGGAIGAAAFPSHVFKGTGMPGQHGNRPVTVRNLEIVDVRPEENLLLVGGAVPGPNHGVVILRSKGAFPEPARAQPEGQEGKAEPST